ncbi:MAG: phage portal protein [Maricaulaceae bacterium]|jgi:HK97 family phage portal protein
MFDRIARALGYERRSYDPAYVEKNFVRPRSAGGFVTPQAVLSNSAVACRAIELKATLLASVPLDLFRRTEDGGRELVRDDSTARALAQPSPTLTRFGLIERISRDLDTRGNFYARLIRDRDGALAEIVPLAPETVSVERLASGGLRYKVTATAGRDPVVLLQDDILHVRNQLDADGVLGVSPISIARAALQTAIAQNEVAGSLASNGLRPSGTLNVPGKLGDPARKILREWLRDYAGSANAGDVPILEEGMKFETTEFSAEDAELLESRKFSAEDVARIFGVNPSALGMSGSVAYASAKFAYLDLVTQTLNPLASRVEAELERCLLPAGSGLFFEFNLSGLLRGDPAERWSTYETARRAGILTTNEIRRLENYPAAEGGDDLTPLRASPTQTTENSQ